MKMFSNKMTKSEMIRRYWDAGLTVSEIANLMGIRYQFAYNVVSYYVKHGGEVLKYVGATSDSVDSVGGSESNQQEDMSKEGTHLGDEG